jgi:hypothetical protein
LPAAVPARIWPCTRRVQYKPEVGLSVTQNFTPRTRGNEACTRSAHNPHRPPFPAPATHTAMSRSWSEWLGVDAASRAERAARAQSLKEQKQAEAVLELRALFQDTEEGRKLTQQLAQGELRCELGTGQASSGAARVRAPRPSAPCARAAPALHQPCPCPPASARGPARSNGRLKGPMCGARALNCRVQPRPAPCRRRRRPAPSFPRRRVWARRHRRRGADRRLPAPLARRARVERGRDVQAAGGARGVARAQHA